MTAVTTPAVLLRAHPWSESSHVLRFLTPDHGVVAVMARGVRSRASRGHAPLETFARGDLTVDLRSGRDLQGFRDFQPGAGDPRRLGRDLLPLTAASYLAELVLAHALEEGSPVLYRRFEGGLQGLEEGGAEALAGVFLATGWGILSDFGFPPEVEGCVGCGGGLAAVAPGVLARFDVEAGGILCPRCAAAGNAEGGRLGPGALLDLQALAGGEGPVPLKGAGVHFGLLDRFALFHLGLSRAFRSAGLLRSLLEAGEAAGLPDEGVP